MYTNASKDRSVTDRIRRLMEKEAVRVWGKRPSALVDKPKTERPPLAHRVHRFGLQRAGGGCRVFLERFDPEQPDNDIHGPRGTDDDEPTWGSGQRGSD